MNIPLRLINKFVFELFHIIYRYFFADCEALKLMYCQVIRMRFLIYWYWWRRSAILTAMSIGSMIPLCNLTRSLSDLNFFFQLRANNRSRLGATDHQIINSWSQYEFLRKSIVQEFSSHTFNELYCLFRSPIICSICGIFDLQWW